MKTTKSHAVYKGAVTIITREVKAGGKTTKRVYALSHAVWRLAFGTHPTIDLRASSILKWSGVQTAEQMAESVAADGYTVIHG